VGPFRAGCLALALAAGSAAACEVPGDGTSLRRALLKVKYLAETEAWERAARRSSTVQYVLSLDAPLEREGRCYWPIEAKSAGATWHTFSASPRGEHILVAVPGGEPQPLEEWRARPR
jgi:hypothetical protein